MDRVLDELVKNSASCIEKMEKKEEWKRMNEELKEMAMKSDDEGVKKLRLIFNDEVEVMKEEMKRNEEEWNGMNVNGVIDDIKRVSEKANMNDSKVYVFSDGQKKEISNELVKKYPECLLNVNMIDVDSRNSDNEVEIDFRFKYLDEIVNYMANEYDIDELNGIEFDEFCVELIEMNIPFRSDIMNRLYNGCNEYGIGWKNRYIVIKKKEYKMMFDCVKLRLSKLKYNIETDRIECTIQPKYKSIIQSYSDYLQDKSKPNRYCSRINRKQLISFLDEYPVDMNNEDVQSFFYPIYSPFLKESIINEQQYDSYLREWIGDFKWKLLYRASQYAYTSTDFNNKKSSEGWIFGGYTTQSWSGNEEKDDDKAFIFTLKNPHGVKPTRFVKREESDVAIICDPNNDPVFGNDDIKISYNCTGENNCWIQNDGTRGYKCDPQYKKSVFVNTGRPDEKNYFSVLDYEVFGIDYKDKYTIDHLCKYPDIMWECIETSNISEEALTQFDDENELLNDLDLIHCHDSKIQLKISNYYFRTPSKLLPNTTIIDKKYDSYLREWIGNYKWKLIYRASEHEYKARSFHEYCDNKGPTLIVIKSSNGCVFGGYTTESWSGNNEIKNDDNAFIFTLKNPHDVEPTQFVRRKESQDGIICSLSYGPVFGYYDMCISSRCNNKNSCWIDNNGKKGYECHSQFIRSLFVNTADPNERNVFTILEYEVYGIDNEGKDNISKLCKYPDIIWRYIQTRDISEESLRQFDDDITLLNDLNSIHCDDNGIRLRISQYYLKNPSELLSDTQIVNRQYDSYLREWLGDYKWRLLYRASEHDYTSKSFHEYCDNVKGPTLVVIKSNEGWVFGGYTTQSWKCIHSNKFGSEGKYDDKAFLFTLKNAYGVEPTRYMKREGNIWTIQCSSDYGPIFCRDIYIHDNCNKENSCWIQNDGTNRFEYDSQYKRSIFVNTNEYDNETRFSVLDYEVYCIENYKDYIYNTCKYPDIIWEYIETTDIPVDSMKQFDDDIELRNDLDVLRCEDSNIRIKISQYYFTNPSELLPDTQIVNQQYDHYLKKWCGDYNWKLIYRASEHGYTASSFHECCDDKGPTLIVIKSREGWIFGGYTTKSWKVPYPVLYRYDVYKNDFESFIFTLKNPHDVEPTQFMKRKDCRYAIKCDSQYGPIFGWERNYDIFICDICNEGSECKTGNDGTGEYECHPVYKQSLFVNTAGPDEENYFSVLDYEVFTHD